MLKAKSSSPLSSIKLSFFKSPKFWGLFAFLIVLAGLPAALFEVQQQQQLHQHAATNALAGGVDSCGHIKVTMDDTPVCSNPNPVSTSTHSTHMLLSSNDGGSYSNITVFWFSYWCSGRSQLGGFGDPNPTVCLRSRKQGQQVVNVSSTSPASVSTPPRTADPPFNACGIWQEDFYFTYSTNNQSCRYGFAPTDVDPDPTHPVLAYGFCYATNTDCQVTSPTATPTPTIVTPTFTITPTDIPSDTPSPTASPSATPTPTIPDTPTVTPTGTLTPTLSPTETPVPLSSPTPTIIVVKPTLPPTGPNNTIVAVGLVGVAISVLGLTLLIGI